MKIYVEVCTAGLLVLFRKFKILKIVDCYSCLYKSISYVVHHSLESLDLTSVCEICTKAYICY